MAQYDFYTNFVWFFIQLMAQTLKLEEQLPQQPQLSLLPPLPQRPQQNNQQPWGHSLCDYGLCLRPFEGDDVLFVLKVDDRLSSQS